MRSGLEAALTGNNCRVLSSHVTIRRITVAVLVAAFSLCAASAASARYTVGIGDQHAQTFSHPLFGQLRIRNARLNVPWDALSRGDQAAEVDAWLAAARAVHVKPLITFTHSRLEPRKLPSVSEYSRAFRAFRARYPWIKQYSPWDEANHQSQPTYHKPQWAAKYYTVVRARCRGCTIVALDVLDQPGMVTYVNRFRHYAKGNPRLWGLHNYRDTNRHRKSGTESLLRAVRGKIWLTETGGIVKFDGTFPYNEQRAAKATRYMFKLARSSGRIKRLYIYSWWGELRGARFDAGLVGPDGAPRPAFYVVKKALHR
jgi:hypothetical protein